MSSHQDPYYYFDTSPNYYESSSGPSVPHPPRYPQQTWPPTATTGDQSGYSQLHQSTDTVGNLLEAQEAEVPLCHNFDGAAVYPPPLSDLQDMDYPFNHPRPDHSLPSTSFQDPGIGTDATYINDHIPSHHFADLSFSHSLEADYRHSQHQYGYAPHESLHDYPNQSFVHGAHQMSGDLAGSFSVHPAQNIHTPQTSQVPAAPVYPYSSSTQLPSRGRDGPVYQTDTTSARPASDSLTLEAIATGRMELPNAGTRQYSHPSHVATASTSTPGPSRPLTGSPERKRLFSSSAADERSTARRVMPRLDRARSVHSTSSRSHGRSRSNSYVYGRGPLIPQDRYTTSSISSYDTPDHPPITFDLENPHQTGIPIIDIINKTDSFARIRDRTQAFSHMGKKTFTLRVRWPGYRPWSKTIAALDWTKTRAPITRVKLAEVVATAVRDLIEKYRDERYDPDYAEWNVGPNGIQLDQLCLVAVHHVSRGSWQPKLCLLEPRR